MHDIVGMLCVSYTVILTEQEYCGISRWPVTGQVKPSLELSSVARLSSDVSERSSPCSSNG